MYECVIRVSHWILLINLELDAFHRIEEKVNVIVELSNSKLLDFSNLRVHVNFVMRMKTPKNKSNDS
jgi:hypothetical protein